MEPIVKLSEPCRQVIRQVHAPQGNIELMPKKKVFDLKLAARLEQINGKRREQTQDRKHRVE
jgi:hypothetical protein